MNKAKNMNRLAIPAVLALILCCVASAGPTYSFVQIAGEWAFYEESDGFNSSLEGVSPGQSEGMVQRNSPIAGEDDNVSLPAVSSVMTLSGDSGKKASYLLLGSPSGGNGSAPSQLPAARSSDDSVSLASRPYGEASPYRVKTTLENNGFKNPDLANSSGSALSKANGRLNPNTPNGNAWGYWKKRPNGDDDDGVTPPVPVPVPGSVILAAIGAGLVKLLHDRRVKR